MTGDPRRQRRLRCVVIGAAALMGGIEPARAEIYERSIERAW